VGGRPRERQIIGYPQKLGGVGGEKKPNYLPCLCQHCERWTLKSSRHSVGSYLFRRVEGFNSPSTGEKKEL